MGDLIHVSNHEPSEEDTNTAGYPGYYDVYDPDVVPELPRNWPDLANCLGMDPDIFFPDGQVGVVESKRQIATAKSVCYACDVQTECRTFALLTNTKFGVWGGLSVIERKEILRRPGPRWAMCKKCGKLQFVAKGKARCCRSDDKDDD